MALSSTDMVGSVLAFLVIDNEGTRLMAKYYNMNFKTIDEELEFEARLFAKSSKMSTKVGDCWFISVIIPPIRRHTKCRSVHGHL